MRIHRDPNWTHLPDKPAVDLREYEQFVDAGDWSPAIQAAIDAAASARLRLFIPPGNYSFEQTITVPDHAHIIGTDATLTLVGDGTTLTETLRFDDHKHRAALTNSDHGDGNADIRIEGLTIDFGATAKDTEYGTWFAFWFYQVSGLALDRCHGSNVVPDVDLLSGRAYGFNVMACDGFRLSDCEASNNGYDGIRLSGGSENGLVERCYHKTPNFRSIIQVADANPFSNLEAATHGAYNTTIRNVRQPDADIIIHGRALGWSESEPTIRTAGITVEDCTIGQCSILGSVRLCTAQRISNLDNSLPAVRIRAAGRSPNASVVEDIVVRDLQSQRVTDGAGALGLEIFNTSNHADDETRRITIYGGGGDYRVEVHTLNAGEAASCRGIRDVRFIGGTWSRVLIDSQYGPITDVTLDGLDMVNSPGDAQVLARIYGDHDIERIRINGCQWRNTVRGFWARWQSGTGEVRDVAMKDNTAAPDDCFCRGSVDGSSNIKLHDVRLIDNLLTTGVRFLRSEMDEVLLELNRAPTVANQSLFIGDATNVTERGNVHGDT